jgi:hypothetical protein
LFPPDRSNERAQNLSITFSASIFGGENVSSAKCIRYTGNGRRSRLRETYAILHAPFLYGRFPRLPDD